MFNKKFNNINEFIFHDDEDEIQQIAENISISSVTNLKDFKKFFKTPWFVYKDDEQWIAPFWIEYREFFKKKNPFWQHAKAKLFVVKKNEENVGRIAAIIDYTYCETAGENIGFFGFFECIHDFTCAEALLQSAQNWLFSKEMIKMQGPINGRVDVGCGFLLTGFDSPPSLLSSYSPTYYLSFVEKFHMKKLRDQLVYYIDLKQPIPLPLQDRAQQCASSGITIRPFNRIRTNKELKWWISLFLHTFSDHWGYVPVDPEEVLSRFGVKQLRWIGDSRLFLIAEYNGIPIAYLWSSPDYNQIFQHMNGRLGVLQLLQFFIKKHRITKGKLHFIGTKKDFRCKYIASYLNYETLVEMKQRGYLGAEVGWIDEYNNLAHKTIEITGAKVYKKYRVFEKIIENTYSEDVVN